MRASLQKVAASTSAAAASPAASTAFPAARQFHSGGAQTLRPLTPRRPLRGFHQTSLTSSPPRKRNFFTSNPLLSSASSSSNSSNNSNTAGSSGGGSNDGDGLDGRDSRDARGGRSGRAGRDTRDSPASASNESVSTSQQQSSTSNGAGRTSSSSSASSSKRKPRAAAVSKSLRLGSMSKQPVRPGKPERPAHEIDPQHVISAICVAREFDMDAVQEVLRYHGFELDPDRLNFDAMAVVHARGVNGADIFVFPYGTVVSWSMDPDALETLATKQLIRAAENPHLDRMEAEDLEYVADDSRDVSYMKGNVVVLGTRKQAAEGDRSDTTLARVAFSSGLARSPKLAVLETGLMEYFQGSKTMVEWLERGLSDRLSASLVLKKTGELLSLRAQLNHYSDITDHLPDMFWDSESHLEDYYNQIGAEMDVRSRISILNRKIDYAHETVSVLREMTTERHSTRLEVIIILLIAVEVFFELRRVYKEEWGQWAEKEQRHGGAAEPAASATPSP